MLVQVMEKDVFELDSCEHCGVPLATSNGLSKRLGGNVFSFCGRECLGLFHQNFETLVGR